MKDIVRAVENYRELILDAERYIWAHPETGYKEFESSKYMAEQFEALGYELTYADGTTAYLPVKSLQAKRQDLQDQCSR